MNAQVKFILAPEQPNSPSGVSADTTGEHSQPNCVGVAAPSLRSC